MRRWRLPFGDYVCRWTQAAGVTWICREPSSCDGMRTRRPLATAADGGRAGGRPVSAPRPIDSVALIRRRLCFVRRRPFEPDDEYFAATYVEPGDPAMRRAFDTESDEDWVRLGGGGAGRASACAWMRLAEGVALTVEIYGVDGLTRLGTAESIDGAAGATRVVRAERRGLLSYAWRPRPEAGSIVTRLFAHARLGYRSGRAVGPVAAAGERSLNVGSSNSVLPTDESTRCRCRTSGDGAVL